VLNILQNPVYGGAYAYGKTAVVTDAPEGQPRKRCVRKPRQQWSVLIPKHHEGYISWNVYERIQRMLSENSSRSDAPGAGAAKNGAALLAGLLRCRRCGRKLRVGYSGAEGNIPRYECDRAATETGESRCISFSGRQLDSRVASETLRVVQPAAIEAAVLAADQQSGVHNELLKALKLDLKAARYDAERARQRYDAVDPTNRLVADELELRWNATLLRLCSLEQKIEAATRQPQPRADTDRKRLLWLANDLNRAWNDTQVDSKTRKRLIRCVIHEIVVDIDQQTNELLVVVHWVGGVHTELRLNRRRRGQSGAHTSKDLVEAVRMLARTSDDDVIAGVLNKNGLKTGRGNRWTKERVHSLRVRNAIPVRCADPKSAQWLTLKHAAALAKISPSALRHAAERGEIPAEHPLPIGPWIFARKALEGSDIRAVLGRIRKGAGAVPSTSQLTLGISST
jgi:hypothetical protein